MTTINAPRELLTQWLGMFEGGIASNPLSALRELTRKYLQSEQPVDDRGAFEAQYAIEYSRATGRETTGADIATMRSGDSYGTSAHYLNGQWAGWKARGTPQPQKYDDTLLPFLELMRAELHANSHKGDREAWLRMTPEQALDEIRHHADKLIGPVLGRDGGRIREHAADVANCAMMLADIAGVLSRE